MLLADKGFSGKAFAATTDALGVRLLRLDRKDETYKYGNLGGVRQRIESVNQTLKGQFGLEKHGGRITSGVFAPSLNVLWRCPRGSGTTGARVSQPNDR